MITTVVKQICLKVEVLIIEFSNISIENVLLKSWILLFIKFLVHQTLPIL